MHGAQRIARPVRQRGLIEIGRAQRQAFQWWRSRLPLRHRRWCFSQPFRQPCTQRQESGLGVHGSGYLPPCQRRLEPQPRAQHRAFQTELRNFAKAQATVHARARDNGMAALGKWSKAA